MNSKRHEEKETEFPSTEIGEFREFIEKLRNEDIIEKKPLLRVILFGSYYPPETKALLENMRDDLKADGYINAWLVEDYPTFEDLGIREKSIYCLEFSDINIFLFTIKGEKGGTTVELEHIINNAKKLSFCSIVCYEIKSENGDEISSLSPLHEDGLISAKIKTIKFKIDDFEELKQLIRGEVWELHYHYVINGKKFKT